MSVFLGAVALIVVFLRAFNRLLLWMDEKDWILLPNREAMIHGESAMLRAFLDAQAVVEPDKRNLVRHDAEKDERAVEDGEGDGRPPRRREDYTE